MDQKKKYIKAYASDKQGAKSNFISLNIYMDDIESFLTTDKNGKKLLKLLMFKKDTPDNYGDYKFLVPEAQPQQSATPTYTRPAQPGSTITAEELEDFLK